MLRPILQHGVKTCFIRSSDYKSKREYVKKATSVLVLKEKNILKGTVIENGVGFSITIEDYPWKILNRRYKREGNFLEDDFAKRFTKRNKPKNKKKKR